MAAEVEQEFEVLKLDNRYEISKAEPWCVRKIENNKCLKQSMNHGYLIVGLGNKTHSIHRIVAHQWIKNDDPENKIFVDHIDRNRLNNSIENLRWVTPKENSLNRTKTIYQKYEYIDELPPDSELIEKYCGHKFDRYYYNIWDEKIYMETKTGRIKIVKPFINGKSAYIAFFDVNDKKRQFGYDKLIDFLKHNY